MLQLLALGHIAACRCAVEVVIVVVSVCATLEFVGARLCDGVDCATAKAAHSHVVGCNDNLQLLDSIQGYGVSIR